ncbi:MAG TPA: hypothetical protein PK869_13640 [Candidatus Hydrogenedentes bacterium]|nr:hypothetical protein [Candidatus Hydrogenedentota bacterium]
MRSIEFVIFARPIRRLIRGAAVHVFTRDIDGIGPGRIAYNAEMFAARSGDRRSKHQH